MPLSVGDKLGHYEVISLLSQGGMGEVYRARDTTIKPDVALKVLPATFLRDADRMARFHREAEVLGSLDHPNIGHIHGIVHSEDSRGLVLALIEGPTLAGLQPFRSRPRRAAFLSPRHLSTSRASNRDRQLACAVKKVRNRAMNRGPYSLILRLSSLAHRP